MSQPKCSAKTAKGTPCKRWAVRGSTTCQAHGGAAVEISEAWRARGQCSRIKRNGERCKKPPLHGTTVCGKHGGNASHIRNKAQRELDRMILPSLAALNAILRREDTTPADKIRIGLAVLDRTGFGKGSTVNVEVEVKPWEQTMSAILVELPTDTDAELEDIEDAEVVEESLPPVADYSRHEQFTGPRISHEGRVPTPTVVGSAEPPERRSKHDPFR